MRVGGKKRARARRESGPESDAWIVDGEGVERIPCEARDGADNTGVLRLAVAWAPARSG